MQPGQEGTLLVHLESDLLGETSEKSLLLRSPTPRMLPAIGCYVRKSLLLLMGLNIRWFLHLPGSRDAWASHHIPAFSLPTAVARTSALRGKSPPPQPHLSSRVEV